jgi:hypothetical protein
MKIIKHRINDLTALKELEHDYGAEIDIRYHNDRLILNHDPLNHHLSPSLDFEQFLKGWSSQQPLILNIKTEGIEKKCIELVNDYKVASWFFLDLSMPYFVKYADMALKNAIPGFSSKNLAVRFSDKEPLEYALNFSGQARWIWVDWFESIPLSQDIYTRIKNNHFQICLVSPELQNKPVEKIVEYKKFLAESSMEVDAVCTKRPDLWK